MKENNSREDKVLVQADPEHVQEIFSKLNEAFDDYTLPDILAASAQAVPAVMVWHIAHGYIEEKDAIDIIQRYTSTTMDQYVNMLENTDGTPHRDA